MGFSFPQALMDFIVHAKDKETFIDNAFERLNL